MYFKKYINLVYYLIISFIIALIWVIIAKDYYGYNHNFIRFEEINSYPLIAWTFGLFIIYSIYYLINNKLKFKGFIKKLILFTSLYIPLLIIAETLGYYIFNVHNIATANYAGLPICNCIHAPLWMQISYFLIGPIYFTIIEFISTYLSEVNIKI